MRTIGFFAVIAIAAAACGGSSTTDANSTGGNTACTVTLSGSISNTASCTVSANYGLDIIGHSDLSILNTGTPGFTLGIETDSKLATGTITQSSSTVDMAVTTATNGTLIWSQDTSDPVHGTVSVNLTSSTLASDGFTLTVHGTVDGTLTPSQATPGASGTVTFHVAF